MRVVLVDDHQILIEGISQLLNEPYEVVGIFAKPSDAIKFIRSHEVDLLITDYEMPGLSGIEVFRQALEHKPLLKGVLLSMHDEASLVKNAMKNGFHGFLLKNVSKNELAIALDKVCKGHTYVSAELTRKMLQVDEKKVGLSDRELQVLKLILKEYTNKQIADALNLSERTVETYRKNLFQKANTNNVVGLVKFAYQHKLAD
jgi:two-component system nitrate/nitrite response regulator NarL